ncbi:hypothetical protein GCM10011506_07170 [Marivirga lumbricoides]|uniref:Lipocalin-like domain-containing protein n=1 Tax=Marivirga lumbricoides TaxID=1046115 RepID=A0ABQ1LI30_9BACT|nr:hypothetical protein GCM10011506_07170 [Marivirga lumbricoides]
MYRLISILFISLLGACADEEYSIEGKWIQANVSGDNITFIRADSLTEDNFGFELDANNELTRVQLVGFCGTEPIQFETVRGKWNQVSDTSFNIEYPFWRGQGKDLFHIKKVYKDSMIVVLLEKDVIKK